MENGEWDMNNVGCDLAYCSPLPIISHASVSYTQSKLIQQHKITRDDQGYAYGTEASFKCGVGYEITDGRPLVCQADQTWSHTLPLCQSKQFLFEKKYYFTRT